MYVLVGAGMIVLEISLPFAKGLKAHLDVERISAELYFGLAEH